jgi:hypothetical protein
VDGTLKQTSAWVEYALATDYQRAVLVAGYGADGEPMAAAVGFITEPRWPLRGFRTMHLPGYPSTRGDIGRLREAVRVCERVAQELQCMTVEFWSLGQPEGVAGMEIPGYVLSQEQLEYTVDLSQGEDALWLRLSRRHRRNVSLSAKRGVCVARADSLESVRALRSLQVEVTRRHAAKGDTFGLRPPEDYDALYKALVTRDLARVYCAYVGDAVVSAVLYLTFGTGARWVYGGSNQLGLETRASLAVLWRAMADLSGEGFLELSLGTATRDIEGQDPASPAYGLHEFKLGFGAQMRPVAAASKVLRPVAVRVYRALQQVRSRLGGGRRRASPARGEVGQ